MPARVGKPPGPVYRRNKLKAWRKERRQTLEQLAATVGASKGHLSNIENMKGGLMPDLAEALASALNINVHMLWNVDPDTSMNIPDDEQVLLGIFRAAKPNQRRTIINISRTIADDEAGADG